MDRKLIAICILTISAVALMIANFVATPLRASAAVNSHDYQLVTALLQSGGEGLYVLDNRTGRMAVFTYDTGTRSLRPRAVRPIAEAFK